MDVFVARQPIFDRALNTYGYELLFREGMENRYTGTEPDQATRHVVAAWLFSIGMERLTAGRRAFINFTGNLLRDGPGAFLDPRTTVIEVLETAEGADVLEACRDLREAGFTIALDDFADLPAQRALVEVADILKIDFLQHPPDARARLTQIYSGPGVSLLAEKVETSEEFDAAKQLGFAFFQGHFFAHPEIVRGRQLPISKLHYLRVLQEINRPQFRFDQLAEIVRRDASLSYRLLRYINSAVFGWRTKVRSIHHAMVLLGEREIRRWATLAALGGVAEDRPQELITSSVVRGRFCELLADRIRMPARAMDLFFLGMLSRFDVIVGRPMEEVLESVHLPDDVHAALVDPGESGGLRSLLDAVVAYEEADWTAVTEWCGRHQIAADVLPELYVQAVDWSEALHRSTW
jgi:EAL and modified HD-GYP domain-containing signal transduction protein